MDAAAPGAGGRRRGPGGKRLTPRREFLHDLALELGQPVEVLARTMTEREFKAWQRYAERRMLPSRRMELALAQLTMWVAVLCGVTDKSVGDFLLDVPTADEAGESDVDDLKSALGFAPRNRGG